MTEYLLEGKYERIELHHVRMGFSDEIGQVGRAGLGKVVHLIALIIRILLARVRIKPDALYYPPASPNLVPLVRDCFLLIPIRWMFPVTVFHFHATGVSEFRESLPWILQKLYRIAYGSPDLSLCLSSLASDDARDFRSKRIVVVPNGIPDQPEATSLLLRESDVPQVLFLSTVSEEKGVGVLLSALAALSEKAIRFRCVIAGPFATANDSRRLRNQCASLGLDQLIEWRGPVTGSAKWTCYRDSDIFCFPTHYRTEGFPVVLLEAMMFSLPTVSTTWRAIPEIVQEGKTGFLTPIRDPQATADCLERLLTDGDKRRQMGEAGRRRYLDHYRVDVFRRRMEDALALEGSASSLPTSLFQNGQ